MDGEYTESNEESVSLAGEKTGDVAGDATASQIMAGEPVAASDDPLDAFQWKLNYRPVSAFVNGHYEARVIIGGNTVIRSGTSAEEVLGLIREQAAKALAKIES